MTRTSTLLNLEVWSPNGNIPGYTPKRLHSLVQDPPTQSYTLKGRNLILASSISDSFMRPRMVPRGHIAFGNVLCVNKQADVTDSDVEKYPRTHVTCTNKIIRL